MQDIPAFDGVDAARFQAEFAGSSRPAIFRGLVRDWPVVQAALESNRAFADYVRRFDRGRPLGAMIGPPRIGGKFQYKNDLAGFNFRRQSTKLSGALDYLLTSAEEEEPSSFAFQSAKVWENLTGFDGENPMPLLAPEIEPRVWIGNQVTVAAHHDPSENIACVVAGRRRFTLFPPDQIGNLYMGPFERTPAGTTISLVDFDEPDLDRHPRFAEALEHGLTAELAPGDAIFIPYMWWHHVRSLDRINMLVNYWWGAPVGGRSHPMDAMFHAMMTIRQLPEAHREAWRAHFDHYVFERNGSPAAHIPEDQQGVLAEPSPKTLGDLREAVVRGLNRG
jgi:hypothetical protein